VDLDRYEEAVESCDRALALRPNYPEALANRSAALHKLGRPAEGLASADAALAVRPDPEALANRGLALWQLGRLDEALAATDLALAQRPDHPLIRFNRAQIALVRGLYAESWRDLECRWQVMRHKRPLDFKQPQWRGEPLAGRTLLLLAEQGFGDTILLSRYVPLAAQCGGVVILEAPAALVPLLEGLPGVARVVACGYPLPPFDLYCPLLSLPLAFGTTLETIPGQHAYLHADPARIARWAPRFAGVPGPRVGLVWSGNLTPYVDPRRSMRLATVRPLLRAGVTLYALQKDLPEAEQAELAAVPELVNLGAEVADWADTAAVIAELDLVITIDTGIANLAGAMGKPTWVMLRWMADWRWMVEGRDDSPWYSSARLFRQSEPGDWAGVVERVRVALAAFGREWRGRDARIVPQAVPATAPAPADVAAGQLVQIGLAHMQAGRLAQAEAAYRRALAAEPWNVDALHLLGVIAFHGGRAKEADALIDKALARRPLSPDMLNNHGLALSDLGRAAEALGRFDLAITLAPAFAEAHCNRGTALRELGHLEEALASYGRAIALRPDYADALSNHGITLVDLGRPAEALASLDRALAVEPDLAAAHCNRGSALHGLRQLPEALASFDRAAALAPEQPEPPQRRAAVLADLGRIDEAVASLDRALKLAPGDAALRAARTAMLARRKRRR
jgi:tetratricopeptide (TPR) repeat protein